VYLNRKIQLAYCKWQKINKGYPVEVILIIVIAVDVLWLIFSVTFSSTSLCPNI